MFFRWPNPISTKFKRRYWNWKTSSSTETGRERKSTEQSVISCVHVWMDSFLLLLLWLSTLLFHIWAKIQPRFIHVFVFTVVCGGYIFYYKKITKGRQTTESGANRGMERLDAGDVCLVSLLQSCWNLQCCTNLHRLLCLDDRFWWVDI